LSRSLPPLRNVQTQRPPRLSARGFCLIWYSPSERPSRQKRGARVAQAPLTFAHTEYNIFDVVGIMWATLKLPGRRIASGSVVGRTHTHQLEGRSAQRRSEGDEREEHSDPSSRRKKKEFARLYHAHTHVELLPWDHGEERSADAASWRGPACGRRRRASDPFRIHTTSHAHTARSRIRPILTPSSS